MSSASDELIGAAAAFYQGWLDERGIKVRLGVDVTGWVGFKDPSQELSEINENDPTLTRFPPVTDAQHEYTSI